MTVEVGARAPEIDLEADSGARVSLDDFSGRWLVLYFYPKDNTPGCTREAHDLTEVVQKLKKLDAAVVGVSKDSVKSHCGFRDKIGIAFPLLSDPDLVAHKAYGVWGPKVLYGRKFEGTIRSTFLISPEGVVAHVWTSVKVDGHADAVLQAVRDARDAAKGAATKGSAAGRAANRKRGAAKDDAANRKSGAAARKSLTGARKGSTTARK